MSATDNTSSQNKGNSRQEPITSNGKSNLNRLVASITAAAPAPKPALKLKKEFKERKFTGREDYFINPLTGRTVKNNAVSRYRINKAIRAANVEIEKFNEEQIKNAKSMEQRSKIKGVKIVDAYSGLSSVQMDMQGINNLEEYFDTVKSRIQELVNNQGNFGGWLPTHVKILFDNNNLSGQKTAFGYSFPATVFSKNEYAEFTKVVNSGEFRLNEGEGGSDILNVDEEPVLNQSSVIIFLGNTGVGAKKFKTCFDIVDVNKTNDDVKKS